MRVTPWNIAKFWKRLMFPPHSFHESRLALKGDLPWEPWLHPAVWFAVMGALVFGDHEIVPPVDDLDWIWITFGLVSPVVGFSSVWMLAYSGGRQRYVALWMRMLADAGIVLAILFYEFERLMEHGFGTNNVQPGFVPNVIMLFAVWYMGVLVWRDMKLVVEVEKLASLIYKDASPSALERVIERMEDAG